MVDPRRLKNRGECNEPTKKTLHSVTPRSLYFMTNNKEPHQFDLEKFSTGMNVIDALPHHKNRFVEFAGRPQLINEISVAIRLKYHSAPTSTGQTVENSLRWWWRFLDLHEEIGTVNAVEDFNDLHYALYCNLGDDLPQPNVASIFFSLLNLARDALNKTRPEHQKLPRLLWTAKQKSKPERSLVPFEDVQAVYHHLKRICFPALHRYEENPDAEPTRSEVISLFVMFILMSGWNTSTAQNVDIETKDAEGNLSCIIPKPDNPKFSYIKSIGSTDQNSEKHGFIKARKNRGGGFVQYAISRNKQSISPANIVSILARQTESLRSRLRQYRDSLETQLVRLEKCDASMRELDDFRLEISSVTRMISSPWIYNTNKKIPRHGTIAEGISKLNDNLAIGGVPALHLYAADINKKTIGSKTKIAKDITLRDLRDSFISWRWMTSHSWLDAMLAAGHTHRKSLITYLKRKQIRAESRKSFLKVGDALWEAAIQGRSADAPSLFTTVISAKVAGATEEQIDRWCKGKDQTYSGMGCLDFFHPPLDIAPNHQEGTGCRIQRCVLCSNSILLPSSVNLLARRLAELRYLRRNISELAWQESTFPHEMQNTHMALQKFEQSAVSIFASKWEEEIRLGKHRPMLSEGMYE